MSTYGCQTFGQDGKVHMDSNIMLGWRSVDTYEVPINTLSVKNYTSLLPSGFTLIAQGYNSRGGICHSVVVNGYEITCTPISNEYSGNYKQGNLQTIIIVFLR